jgi:hypothetical protein
MDQTRSVRKIMLIIDNYDDLLALNRALMEVRYLASDIDPATRGSSFLSDVHSRVVDEIVAKAESSGNAKEVERWQSWRQFRARSIERLLLLDYLRSVWRSDAEPDQKRRVVTNQLRPFAFTDDDLDQLLSVLDGATE